MPFSHKFVPKILFSGLFSCSVLRRFLILNSSEYAPDLLSARGVANPGAPFFRPQGKFFATNRAPDVRTKCARFHHETAKAPEPRIKRSARPAACQRVDCGITKTCRTREGKPLARLNVPSASPGMPTPASCASCRSLSPRHAPQRHSLTNSKLTQHRTIKSASTASPQTKNPTRSSQPCPLHLTPESPSS